MKTTLIQDVLKGGVRVGSKTSIYIDGVLYPCEIVGADYLTKTIEVKLKWEVK